MMMATGPYANQSGTATPRPSRKPGEPPRALRKTLSQAIDLHHEGIIYGTMISSERTFFPGKSLRTMSHAMMLPKGTAIKQVKNEISSE